MSDYHSTSRLFSNEACIHSSTPSKTINLPSSASTYAGDALLQKMDDWVYVLKSFLIHSYSLYAVSVRGGVGI
ncbi:hypothetical protein FRC03_004689 [Tulasnella sp. 419]|nr:hypothetical protein FRC03_004689 [Tulasnella sp. 419]